MSQSGTENLLSRKRSGSILNRENKQIQKRDEPLLDCGRAEVEKFRKERKAEENHAKTIGKRVEKKPKQRPRAFCCVYGKVEGISSKSSCICGHRRCAECLLGE